MADLSSAHSWHCGSFVCFGNSAAFWLNAQRAVDLWDAAQTGGNEVESIRPLAVTQRP